MRLICPNCGAQYEVGDDVIPDSGRDVQCSNCSHTWFEHPGASEAAEYAPERPVPSVREPQPEPVHEPEPDPEPVREPEPEPEPEPARDPEPEPETGAKPISETKPTPHQRALDPDVADILREEAAFEQAARQRRAGADPIETQPDLNLSHDPDDDRRDRETRDRLARLRGAPEVTPKETASAVSAAMPHEADAPRRDLLPDIEEINSTLRQVRENPEQAYETEDLSEQRSGFARGFMTSVVIALIALAVYVFAEQISAALPQVEPALTSYADWVNELRLWLDGQMRDVIDAAAADTAAMPES